MHQKHEDAQRKLHQTLHPMSYRATVKQLLRAFPTLFFDENDVLCDLFFISGNGYEWFEGQLVRRGPLRDTPVADVRPNNHRSRKNRRFRLRHRESLELNARIRLLLSEHGCLPPDHQTESVADRTEHFVNRYSRIVSIPDDVKPDWLAAARKVLELARTRWAGQFTPDGQEWLERAANRVRILEKAVSTE